MKRKNNLNPESPAPQQQRQQQQQHFTSQHQQHNVPHLQPPPSPQGQPPRLQHLLFQQSQQNITDIQPPPPELQTLQQNTPLPIQFYMNYNQPPVSSITIEPLNLTAKPNHNSSITHPFRLPIQQAAPQQDRLANRNQFLEEQVDNLKEELNSAEANCSKLEEEYKEFIVISDEEKKQLKRKNKVKVVKLQKELKNSKDSYNIKIDELEKKLNEAESKVQSQIAQLEKSSKEYSELLNESKSLKDNIQILEGDKEKIKRLQTEIKNLSEKLSDNELSMRKMNEGVTNMEEKLHYFKKRAETFEETNGSLEKENQIANEDIKKLKDEVSNLTGENHKLSEKVTKLQAKEEKQDIEKSSIIIENKTAISKLNEKIKNLNTSSRISYLRIKELESELEEQRKTSSSEQAELAKKLSQQVSGHQITKQALKNKLETIEELKRLLDCPPVDTVEVVEELEQSPQACVNELPMGVQPTIPPTKSEVATNSINKAVEQENNGIEEIDLTGDSDGDGDNDLSETATTSVKKNARKLEEEGDQHKSLRKRLGLDAAIIDPVALKQADVTNMKLRPKRNQTRRKL